MSQKPPIRYPSTVDNSWITVDNSSLMWRNRSIVREKVENYQNYLPPDMGGLSLTAHIWKRVLETMDNADLVQNLSTWLSKPRGRAFPPYMGGKRMPSPTNAVYLRF